MDDQNDNSLKTACVTAYKSEPSNVVTTMDNDVSSTKFLVEQVWKYCSFLEEAPKTLKNREGVDYDNEDKQLLNSWGESKIASDKKNDLLAVFTRDNELA